MLGRLRLKLAAPAAAGAAVVIGWVSSTGSADAARAPRNPSHQAPGMEILIHNISHSDFLVRLREESVGNGTESTGRSFLARPQFNAFRPVSDACLRELEHQEADGHKAGTVSAMSRYSVKYPIGIDLQGEKKSLDGATIPMGGQESGDGASQAWSLFHLKGSRDKVSPHGSELSEQATSVPRVVAVYLPLLAVVIPEWLRTIKRRALTLPGSSSAPPRKVVVLVSGAGQPRNEKANPSDNSTQGVGWLMERFIRLVHPEIEVVHIVSSSYGIFRYDDNVRFVKEQVLPVIEAKRSEVVAAHGDEWSSRLKITVCLADGAPARISALNAAMRSYRPDYIHVWRYKTFWDTQMLSEEDVESHTFKKLEMRPATHRSQLAELEKGLVQEMIRYKRQFEAVRESNEHELGTFWLRKTGKAVLAVLLTVKPDGQPTYWRGMNVEVSMPTGTLCAERNAIGNALAADQSVQRGDMQAVAVLSVSLDPTSNSRVESAEIVEVANNPLDPCGACMEWLKKIAEVNPDFKVLTFTSTNCEKVFTTPIGDYG